MHCWSAFTSIFVMSWSICSRAAFLCSGGGWCTGGFLIPDCPGLLFRKISLPWQCGYFVLLRPGGNTWVLGFDQKVQRRWSQCQWFNDLLGVLPVDQMVSTMRLGWRFGIQGCQRRGLLGYFHGCMLLGSSCGGVVDCVGQWGWSQGRSYWCLSFCLSGWGFCWHQCWLVLPCPGYARVGSVWWCWRWIVPGFGLVVPCLCSNRYCWLKANWDPMSTCWLSPTWYPDNMMNFLSSFPQISMYAHCPRPVESDPWSTVCVVHGPCMACLVPPGWYLVVLISLLLVVEITICLVADLRIHWMHCQLILFQTRFVAWSEVALASTSCRACAAAFQCW